MSTIDIFNQKAFQCPKCGGTHFGSTFPDAVGWVDGEATKDTVLGEPRRHCHDEFEVGCKWTGTSAECMTRERV